MIKIILPAYLTRMLDLSMDWERNHPQFVCIYFSTSFKYVKAFHFCVQIATNYIHAI